MSKPRNAAEPPRCVALTTEFLAKLDRESQSRGLRVKRDSFRKLSGRSDVCHWWERLMGGESVPIHIAEALVKYLQTHERWQWRDLTLEAACLPARRAAARPPRRKRHLVVDVDLLSHRPPLRLPLHGGPGDVTPAPRTCPPRPR